MAPVQFLPRWQPNGEALYQRRLGVQWHDMCAESLGMPKVALCFLTRGPVHQVLISCTPLHDLHLYRSLHQAGALSLAHSLLLACAQTCSLPEPTPILTCPRGQLHIAPPSIGS